MSTSECHYVVTGRWLSQPLPAGGQSSPVLVLGLSYKAGTADWRKSPSVAVTDRLLQMGADVRAREP
jgi:UDP-N-acetyl-D-mannosaminuronate dehydrogenase